MPASQPARHTHTQWASLPVRRNATPSLVGVRRRLAKSLGRPGRRRQVLALSAPEAVGSGDRALASALLTRLTPRAPLSS